ncbi:retrovirus-related Pol polyprotein from transposon 412 [Trichonephila clavipes]|nr:retrovirus-related Pol polyprotein from transposon 412 [Trichonephila clavipes]
MVTGDEKWVTYYNIVRKRSWSKCGETAQTVAKPGLSAKKVLLCICKVVISSVYHPQSNPVERIHRTLKRILRVLCLEAIPDWEKILPQALFALRTVIHDSTGFSPAELVHGKNLRTPVMLLYEKLTEEESVESSVVDYVFELINRMK